MKILLTNDDGYMSEGIKALDRALGVSHEVWTLAPDSERSGMSHAIVAALRELGIQRVAVATSYIDELNDRLVDYLTGAGFTVTAIRGMSITGVQEVGEVPTKALVDLSNSVYREDTSAQGVFISCGGLLTLDAIKQLEDRLGLPATASSPAGFWDVVRLGGAVASSPGFGRLFEGR